MLALSTQTRPDHLPNAATLVQERKGDVSSFEILTTYSRISPSIVEVMQREVYFGPSQVIRDLLSGGRSAVAAFEYHTVLTRVPPPADAYGAAACVRTPKDFVQCV